MRQQRRIEEEDSDGSDTHDKGMIWVEVVAKEMKKLDNRPPTGRNQGQRLKGPFSDDSSEEEVSNQPLFKVETPAPNENLVYTIQDLIKLK